MKARNPAFLILAIILLLTRTDAAPFITEFLASNQAGLADEDGERPDWIEIFNPDATAVDLGGYRLTDDAGSPAKWVFPAGVTIQPGGYLVVFASDKNRAVAGSPLHTSFNLNANGEYLAFSEPGGAILSEYTPAFPAQTPDVSYGVISTTPGAQQAYFNTPTPGAENNTATAPAEAVQFSHSSRTFNQGTTLNVALSVASPTATIRYTTNRSVPTATSTLYTGTPIPVNVNTRIRARAFEPGRPDGPVVSETYFRIDAAAQTFASNLPIVVTTSWGATMNNDVTVPAHIMVFEPKPGDNLARLTNLPDLSTPCSIERRGSSTAGDPKYSLTVELWDESNNDRDFSILGMPPEADWVMHAPYNFDRSLMHNDLIYRLSNDMGRYAVRTKFVEHFHNTTNIQDGIEGAVAGGVDYFGVYSFMEKIKRGSNRVAVEKLTTLDNTAPVVQGGYIFKVDRLDAGDSGIRPLTGQSFGGVGIMGPGSNVMAWVDPKENSTDPSLVVTLSQSNYLRQYIGDAWAALSGPDFMDPATGYAAWWDVPAVIDNHILNVSTKNADALRLSAFWHKPRFGKLTAGPLWDFDRAQGSTDGRDLNPNTWRGDTGDLGTDFFHYPWYNEMFRDPNFWQAWIDRYHQLRLGVLSTANVHATIDTFAAQLNPGDGPSTPAKRNVQRWTGVPPRGASANTPGTNGTYVGEIAWLKNWWASRLAFMDGQFTRPAVPSIASGPVPSGTNISLSSPSQATPGVKIYYTTDGTDPRLPDTQPYGTTTLLTTLIPETNPVFAIVPTSAATGGPTDSEWRGADLNLNGNNQDDYDHSAWFTAPPGSINGVGYDDNLTISYLPYIGIRWSTAATPIAPNNATNTMRNVNPSCYARLPFTISPADAAHLTAPNQVKLHVRYDDGFVAWINGVEVARSGTVPGATTPAWNTGISATHDDTASTIYEEFDITPHLGSLHAGQNILALQGINGGGTPAASSDLVLQCKMTIVAPPAGFTPRLSASAVEYTGPITITQPTAIVARTINPVFPSDPPTQTGGGTGTVPNGSPWSAPTTLYYFPGASSATAANVRITEIHYHPPAPTAAEITAGYTNSNDFEFIRITNTGTTPVDLTGAYFSNGVSFTFPPGLQNWLPVGASIVLVENTPAFQSRYGTTFTIAGQYQGELDDGGERLVLRDKNGTVIADFTYNDSPPWPTAADGRSSLVHLSGNQNVASNWRASLDPGGTGVTDYPTFKQRHFHGTTIPASLQDPDDDPDGDGLFNLVEFALALDPTLPNTPNFTSPLYSVRRRPAAGTSLTYTLQHTENAALGWNDGGPPFSITQNADGTETAVYSIPNPGATSQLLRMKITAP